MILIPLQFAQAQEQAKRRVPVLVELFTSEGCSSCPPADDLLARLDQKQVLEGIEVIPLGLHVDYWDFLGWHDPFSSSDHTRRQKHYARNIGFGRSYTPQMVADGRIQWVGSNLHQSMKAIRKAGSSVKPPVPPKNSNCEEFWNKSAFLVVSVL
jgi:hypothetical protein